MPIRVNARYGFREVTPRPSTAEFELRYRKDFYRLEKPDYLERYESELAYWQLYWAVRLRVMAGALGGPGRLLDIGAGGGFFLHCAAEHGWSVHGVEPSAAACRFARKRFGIVQRECFLEELEIPRERFDAVHMAMVLEHVLDPEQVVRQAYGLLRPGGVLWVEVPNDFNVLQDAARRSMGKHEWWVVPEHHLNYFDFDSLARLLEDCGGKVEERMASFPMEMLLMMGMDYIDDDTVGRRAHACRMQFEQRVLEHRPEALLALYRQLARGGIGRTCSVMAVKQ